MRRRRRRYQSNPTAREIGALVMTTAITAGVAALVTWWITSKLERTPQQSQQQPSQLPKGSYWA